MFVALLAASAFVGADPLPEAAQKELKLLQGEWIMVKAEKDGKARERQEGEDTLVVVIRDDKWILKTSIPDDKREDDKARIVMIDPSTSPKCLNMKSRADGHVSEAIYKLEGDTLMFCWHQGPPSDKTRQRPSEFKSTDGNVVMVLKRVKK